jgi:type IV pilus biogenesis protein CpaD/CtpE
MNVIHPLPRGLLLACLTLSLAACASKPVKPEAVEVRVPVYVRLPAELTEPVTEPVLKAGPVTNADLADWADALREALQHANGKLARIRALQPKEGTDVAEAR